MVNVKDNQEYPITNYWSDILLRKIFKKKQLVYSRALSSFYQTTTVENGWVAYVTSELQSRSQRYDWIRFPYNNWNLLKLSRADCKNWQVVEYRTPYVHWITMCHILL